MSVQDVAATFAISTDDTNALIVLRELGKGRKVFRHSCAESTPSSCIGNVFNISVI